MLLGRVFAHSEFRKLFLNFTPNFWDGTAFFGRSDIYYAKNATDKRVITFYQEKRHENRTFFTRQNRPENTPENTPENS
jgi:hypothetical protein